MAERLQKIIAASGLMSRRAAEEHITAGRVTVNGSIASLGDKAEQGSDIILVDGKPLPSSGVKRYIMLNKPVGYVTTLSDEKGRRNVGELVRDAGTRVYPVGRLDMYSEGLLILTNDGDFANLLMHPSYCFAKTYRTWVKGADIDAAIGRLRGDMVIDGYAIHPAAVEPVERRDGSGVLDITISEGRNRQVRKMCAQAGLKVERLMRISEGPVMLGGLPKGKWRDLTADEIEAVKNADG